MSFNLMGTRGLHRIAARPTVVAALVAAWGASAAHAQDTQPAHAQDTPPAVHAQEAPSDSPIKSALKIVGLATDVGEPPDFVQKSRPAHPLPTIHPFAKPPEPPGTAKSANEVQDIDNDLESISKRDEALLATFPPSAKAVADAAAAKEAKAKTKQPRKSPIPTF